MDENETVTLDDKMQEMVSKMMDDMDQIGPKDPSYLKVADSITKAYAAWVESVKAGIDFKNRETQREFELSMKNLDLTDREAQRELDLLLKRMEIDARKESDEMEFFRKKEEMVTVSKTHNREMVIQVITDVAKVVVPIAGLVITTALGWKNENDPIHPMMLTSATTRETRNTLNKSIKF